MTEKTRLVPPKAAALMESLRGLGYSTAAALADLIDNSVSAGATEVRIGFSWDGPNSRISVLDNGFGMNDSELECAMRLGERSPLDTRSSSDLGRFGMGLKTASFSQCRRLTVASIRGGASPICLRWDLDSLLARPDDGWILFEGPAQGSEHHLAALNASQSGTLVLWEKLDRVVTSGFTVDDFSSLIGNVEIRLSMIFHRYLQGPGPKFSLFLNGRSVVPWDPFMSGHPAKPWNSPVAKMATPFGSLEAECHVLPHRDRLTQQEYEFGGGPEGWTAQQGFYVYRNRRLLLAGGWLGLGQGRVWNREEPHRLARIRLDIPNSADAEWKIDIRKSTAKPPVPIRVWLTKLAEDTRERARRVFAFRGSPTPGPSGAPVDQAWRAMHGRAGMRYRIDEKHPAVMAVLDGAGSRLPLIRAMLKVIEETVPVQRIWLDTNENREIPRTGFAGEPSGEVLEVLQVLFEDMIGRRGIDVALAKRKLLTTEPFNNFPQLIESLGEHSGTSPNKGN